jgi:hypothetical protein
MLLPTSPHTSKLFPRRLPQVVTDHLLLPFSNQNTDRGRDNQIGISRRDDMASHLLKWRWPSEKQVAKQTILHFTS